MNLWDVLILLCVATAVFCAVRAIRKGKAGGCRDCTGSCSACARHCDRK